MTQASVAEAALIAPACSARAVTSYSHMQDHRPRCTALLPASSGRATLSSAASVGHSVASHDYDTRHWCCCSCRKQLPSGLRRRHARRINEKLYSRGRGSHCLSRSSVGGNSDNRSCSSRSSSNGTVHIPWAGITSKAGYRSTDISTACSTFPALAVASHQQSEPFRQRQQPQQQQQQECTGLPRACNVTAAPSSDSEATNGAVTPIKTASTHRRTHALTSVVDTIAASDLSGRAAKPLDIIQQVQRTQTAAAIPKSLSKELIADQRVEGAGGGHEAKEIAPLLKAGCAAVTVAEKAEASRTKKSPVSAHAATPSQLLEQALLQSPQKKHDGDETRECIHQRGLTDVSTGQPFDVVRSKGGSTYEKKYLRTSTYVPAIPRILSPILSSRSSQGNSSDCLNSCCGGEPICTDSPSSSDSSILLRKGGSGGFRSSNISRGARCRNKYLGDSFQYGSSQCGDSSSGRTKNSSPLFSFRCALRVPNVPRARPPVAGTPKQRSGQAQKAEPQEEINLGLKRQMLQQLLATHKTPHTQQPSSAHDQILQQHQQQSLKPEREIVLQDGQYGKRALHTKEEWQQVRVYTTEQEEAKQQQEDNKTPTLTAFAANACSGDCCTVVTPSGAALAGQVTSCGTATTALGDACTVRPKAGLCTNVLRTPQTTIPLAEPQAAFAIQEGASAADSSAASAARAPSATEAATTEAVKTTTCCESGVVPAQRETYSVADATKQFESSLVIVAPEPVAGGESKQKIPAQSATIDFLPVQSQPQTLQCCAKQLAMLESKRNSQEAKGGCSDIQRATNTPDRVNVLVVPRIIFHPSSQDTSSCCNTWDSSSLSSCCCCSSVSSCSYVTQHMRQPRKQEKKKRLNYEESGEGSHHIIDCCSTIVQQSNSVGAISRTNTEHIVKEQNRRRQPQQQDDHPFRHEQHHHCFRQCKEYQLKHQEQNALHVDTLKKAIVPWRKKDGALITGACYSTAAHNSVCPTLCSSSIPLSHLGKYSSRRENTAERCSADIHEGSAGQQQDKQQQDKEQPQQQHQRQQLQEGLYGQECSLVSARKDGGATKGLFSSAIEATCMSKLGVSDIPGFANSQKEKSCTPGQQHSLCTSIDHVRVSPPVMLSSLSTDRRAGGNELCVAGDPPLETDRSDNSTSFTFLNKEKRVISISKKLPGSLAPQSPALFSTVDGTDVSASSSSKETVCVSLDAAALVAAGPSVAAQQSGNNSYRMPSWGSVPFHQQQFLNGAPEKEYPVKKSEEQELETTQQQEPEMSLKVSELRERVDTSALAAAAALTARVYTSAGDADINIYTQKGAASLPEKISEDDPFFKTESLLGGAEGERQGCCMLTPNMPPASKTDSISQASLGRRPSLERSHTRLVFAAERAVTTLLQQQSYLAARPLVPRGALSDNTLTLRNVEDMTAIAATQQQQHTALSAWQEGNGMITPAVSTAPHILPHRSQGTQCHTVSQPVAAGEASRPLHSAHSTNMVGNGPAESVKEQHETFLYRCQALKDAPACVGVAGKSCVSASPGGIIADVAVKDTLVRTHEGGRGTAIAPDQCVNMSGAAADQGPSCSYPTMPADPTHSNRNRPEENASMMAVPPFPDLRSHSTSCTVKNESSIVTHQPASLRSWWLSTSNGFTGTSVGDCSLEKRSLLGVSNNSSSTNIETGEGGGSTANSLTCSTADKFDEHSENSKSLLGSSRNFDASSFVTSSSGGKSGLCSSLGASGGPLTSTISSSNTSSCDTSSSSLISSTNLLCSSVNLSCSGSRSSCSSTINNNNEDISATASAPCRSGVDSSILTREGAHHVVQQPQQQERQPSQGKQHQCCAGKMTEGDRFGCLDIQKQQQHLQPRLSGNQQPSYPWEQAVLVDARQLLPMRVQTPWGLVEVSVAGDFAFSFRARSELKRFYEKRSIRCCGNVLLQHDDRSSSDAKSNNSVNNRSCKYDCMNVNSSTCKGEENNQVTPSNTSKSTSRGRGYAVEDGSSTVESEIARDRPRRCSTAFPDAVSRCLRLVSSPPKTVHQDGTLDITEGTAAGTSSSASPIAVTDAEHPLIFAAGGNSSLDHATNMAAFRNCACIEAGASEVAAAGEERVSHQVCIVGKADWQEKGSTVKGELVLADTATAAPKLRSSKREQRGPENTMHSRTFERKTALQRQEECAQRSTRELLFVILLGGKIVEIRENAVGKRLLERYTLPNLPERQRIRYRHALDISWCLQRNTPRVILDHMTVGRFQLIPCGNALSVLRGSFETSFSLHVGSAELEVGGTMLKLHTRSGAAVRVPVNALHQLMQTPLANQSVMPILCGTKRLPCTDKNDFLQHPQHHPLHQSLEEEQPQQRTCSLSPPQHVHAARRSRQCPESAPPIVRRFRSFTREGETTRKCARRSRSCIAEKAAPQGRLPEHPSSTERGALENVPAVLKALGEARLPLAAVAQVCPIMLQAYRMCCTAEERGVRRFQAKLRRRLTRMGHPIGEGTRWTRERSNSCLHNGRVEDSGAGSSNAVSCSSQSIPPKIRSGVHESYCDKMDSCCEDGSTDECGREATGRVVGAGAAGKGPGAQVKATAGWRPVNADVASGNLLTLERKVYLSVFPVWLERRYVVT